jgi:arylsulfatase A-like enzyme
VDYVEQKGLIPNTLFIYVTDNGWIQDPDKPNVYAPRSKREPYEMGIRTPIIFNWQGKIEPSFNTKNPVSSIDIATTIYEICGIEAPDDLQGINVLDDSTLNARETIFAETFAHDFTTIDSSLYYRMAINLPWKLILPDGTNKTEASTELFNIEQDPIEKENLVEENPEVVGRLKNQIEDWWNQK